MLGAQGLHFFLQPQFLTLQLPQSQFVRRWAAGFVLDGSIESLMPDTEFTNAGFNRHGLRLHVFWLHD